MWRGAHGPGSASAPGDDPALHVCAAAGAALALMVVASGLPAQGAIVLLLGFLSFAFVWLILDWRSAPTRAELLELQARLTPAPSRETSHHNANNFNRLLALPPQPRGQEPIIDASTSQTQLELMTQQLAQVAGVAAAISREPTFRRASSACADTSAPSRGVSLLHSCCVAASAPGSGCGDQTDFPEPIPNVSHNEYYAALQEASGIPLEDCLDDMQAEAPTLQGCRRSPRGSHEWVFGSSAYFADESEGASPAVLRNHGPDTSSFSTSPCLGAENDEIALRLVQSLAALEEREEAIMRREELLDSRNVAEAAWLDLQGTGKRAALARESFARKAAEAAAQAAREAAEVAEKAAAEKETAASEARARETAEREAARQLHLEMESRSHELAALREAAAREATAREAAERRADEAEREKERQAQRAEDAEKAAAATASRKTTSSSSPSSPVTGTSSVESFRDKDRAEASSEARLSFFEAVEAYTTYQGYQAVREVGRGTAGRAVLLQSESTGDRVVGKVLLLDELRESDSLRKVAANDSTAPRSPTVRHTPPRLALRQVEQEISMLTKIKHTHVIDYIATFQVPDPGICVLMEYAAGGDLAKVIRSAQRDFRALGGRGGWRANPASVLSSVQIATWLSQLTAALRHIHSMKIIHRDLAPKNVLLTDDLQVKLSDFGLSFQLGQSTALTTSVVGTPYCELGWASNPESADQRRTCRLRVVYVLWSDMAPELLKHESYGKAVDLWSLGVVAYELLSLHRPFGGRSMEELVDNVLAYTVSEPASRALQESSHPPYLKELVTKPEVRGPRIPRSTRLPPKVSAARKMSPCSLPAQALLNLDPDRRMSLATVARLLEAGRAKHAPSSPKNVKASRPPPPQHWTANSRATSSKDRAADDIQNGAETIRAEPMAPAPPSPAPPEKGPASSSCRHRAWKTQKEPMWVDTLRRTLSSSSPAALPNDSWQPTAGPANLSAMRDSGSTGSDTASADEAQSDAAAEDFKPHVKSL